MKTLVIGSILALTALAQTPILQPKPEFKAGVEYRRGSFTVEFYEVDNAERLILVGSGNPRITDAFIEIFYQGYLKGVKGPVLLHQEITCLVIPKNLYPTSGCTQALHIPVAAIKMIRIRGSAEVETVEIGRS